MSEDLTFEVIEEALIKEEKRLSGVRYLEAKNLAVNTVMPLLRLVVDWVESQLEELRESLDEFAGEDDALLIRFAAFTEQTMKLFAALGAMDLASELRIEVDALHSVASQLLEDAEEALGSDEEEPSGPDLALVPEDLPSDQQQSLPGVDEPGPVGA